MSDAETLLANLSILTRGRDDRDYLALKKQLDAALSSARAEVLEEARDTFENGGVFSGTTVRAVLKELGAKPAPATIPVERVREHGTALLAKDPTGVTSEEFNHAWDSAVRAYARRLGVDLDAKGEVPQRCRRHPLCEQARGHDGTCGDADEECVPAHELPGSEVPS